MPKRANSVMVPEDDPQWMRFWDVYPLRTSKKDARKAWAEVNPSPELVGEMLTTLAWQGPMWIRQGYGMPYPASWLRGERWKDEPPPQVKRMMSDAAAAVFDVLGITK